MGRLQTLKSLRATYRNWVRLALTLSLGSRTPDRVVLKNGSQLGRPARRGSLFALAEARRSGWLVRGDTPGRIALSPSREVTLHARWSEGFDLENAIEVFTDRVYASDVRGKVVLDVGASFGDTPLFFASEGASRVIALEPNRESMALAEQNVRESRFNGRIALIAAAAGTRDGFAEMHYPSSIPNAASLAPAAAAEARWSFDRAESVPVRSLGSLIDEARPDRIGLLKVDCQGYEYDLMASVSAAEWSQVDSVVLEFSDGRRSLPDLFANNGFRVSVTPGIRGYLRAVRPGNQAGKEPDRG
jgi:FkbM family methyltransferase